MHLPLVDLVERIGEHAPDLDTEVVVYCWGSGCNGSTKAGLALARAGYARVKELVGGFEYWAREGFAVVSDNGRSRSAPDPLTAPATAPASWAAMNEHRGSPPARSGLVGRVVGTGEVGAIQSLVAEHARYERRLAPLAEDWAQRATGLIESGQLMLFTAERNGRPIGYAALTHEVSTWSAGTYAHLDCLFVSAEERGGGVGGLLFEAVTTAARRRGDGELQWQTPVWNEGAVRFYDRLGGSSELKRRYTTALFS